MKVTVDLKFFIPAIISLAIAYMTVTESIDNYISFAGEANAAGFFMCSGVMGLICLAGSFSKAES